MKNDCKIQKGLIKIIHPIDLAKIDEIIMKLTKLSYHIVSPKSSFYEIITHKMKEVHDNLYQLTPQRHHRRKRWDALGTAWKWLAGNPDADDLRIIDGTMNELTVSNNAQFTINERVNERLMLMANDINGLVNATYRQNEISEDMEALKLMLNFNMVNEILQKLQDAVIGSKIGLPSNKIFTVEEINTIKNLLVDQDIKIDFLDEVFGYVKPKLATNGSSLIYILEIPQTEREAAKILTIYPLNINGTTIAKYPNHLVQYKDKIFLTTNPDSHLQRFDYLEPFNDDCIHPLVVGTKSTCDVVKEADTQTRWIAEGTILLTNAKKEVLTTTCGPESQTLNGNFLLTFRNCSLTLQNETFLAEETILLKGEVQQTFVAITTNLRDDLNLSMIQTNTLENRREIGNIHWRQTYHDAIGLSSVLILTGIAYIIWLFVRKSENMRRRNQISQQSAMIKNLVDNINQRKTVDALLHPPEEL